MCVASVANAGASMLTTINNSKSFNTTFYGGNNLVNATYKDYKPTDENISLSITYNKPDASAVGYLDYIEIHAMCSLGQHNAIVPFRNADIVGAGNIAKYNFDTQGKNTIIWDVSDRHNIRQIQGLKNGNRLSFTLPADTLREMIAFDGSAFGSIAPVGKINNQDLHGLPAGPVAQHIQHRNGGHGVPVNLDLGNRFFRGINDHKPQEIGLAAAAEIAGLVLTAFPVDPHEQNGGQIPAQTVSDTVDGDLPIRVAQGVIPPRLRIGAAGFQPSGPRVYRREQQYYGGTYRQHIPLPGWTLSGHWIIPPSWV